MDDPSTDDSPIDANGSDGGDNRGGGGVLSAETALTDGTGKAEVEFTVTMKPGDNFRVGADCSDLASVTDNDVPTANDSSVPGQPGKYTEMLSVWRKLYVEVDGMGAPPSSEPFGTISGTSSKIEANALESQGTPGWPSDALNGGVLNPDGNTAANSVDYVSGTSWDVSANTDKKMTVVTDYTGDGFDTDGDGTIDEVDEEYEMTAEDPSNKDFAVNTDDPKWLTDLNPPTDSATIAGLNGYYRTAYIECVLQTANTTPTFSFVRNEYNLFANTVDVAGSGEYWAVAVAWCYDSRSRKEYTCSSKKYYVGDDDPEGEGLRPSSGGISATILGKANGIPGTTADIYVECLRDKGRPVLRTTAHEIGHLLGLYHAPYAGSFDPDDNGIMRWQKPSTMCIYDWAGLSMPTPNDRFSNNNLDALRSR